MQSKFDWLLYNEPSTFAELVLSDRLQAFLDDYGKSYVQQENTIRKQLEDKFSPETAREIAREFMMYES